MESLKVWRHYLLGVHFKLLTDNWANVHIQVQPHLDGKRQTRWMQTIQEYHLDISHLKGAANIVADALSRRHDYELHTRRLRPIPETDHLRGTTAVLAQVQEDLCDDTQYTKFHSATEKGERPDFKIRDGYLYHCKQGRERLYIPIGTLRAKLLREAHEAAFSGHLGRDKTLERLQRSYFWPKMGAAVHDYVRTCPSCQVNKASNQLPIGLLQPLAIPKHKWEHVSMDLITHLPPTSHQPPHDAIIVFVDKLSKMIHAVPTTTTVTAEQTASIFFDTIFRMHGLPRVIISDRDPRFSSAFWQALFQRTGTRLAMSTANHPQTDGQTERANRTIEEMLRAYVCPHHNDWDKYLTAVEFAYNDSVHPGTGHTPFYLNYGQHPHTPLSLAAQPPSSVGDESAEQFASRIAQHTEHARSLLLKAQERMKRHANTRRKDHTFHEGDQVLLLASHFTHSHPSNLMATNASRKLSPRSYGPFKIVKVLCNGTALKLDFPITWSKLHPVIHSSHVRPYLDSSDRYPLRLPPAPPPPDLHDNDQFFAVHSFISHRTVRKQLQYLVQWVGYSDFENTWEPAARLREDLGDDVFTRLSDEYHSTTKTAPSQPKDSTTKRRSAR